MAVTIEKLKETYNTFNHKYEGRLEDYFSPLFIADKFEKPIESVLDKCAFGNNDYGFDAYFIDKETKNLYLYQFKWSDNYELFKETYKRLIKDGIERVFGDPLTDSKINKVIPKLKIELDEYRDIINKVFICFVFNGDVEKAEGSKVLESLREDLESKKHFIDNFFGRNDITLTIQYISNETRRVNQTSKSKKTFQYEIKFKTQSSKTASNGEELHVGFVNLYDLYKMFADMKQRLFEKNIRAGLEDDLAPNQAIKRSLKDIVITKKTNPEYFTFHHNGVTLHAEKLTETDGKAIIIEPRVLNGAQTITTFSRFIEQLPKTTPFADFEEQLNKIEVIGRIITKCETEFVTQVTISNNKQNPVESWNLRANDLIQLEFEDKFKEDGLFYERQENSFANLRDSDLEEMGIEHQKEIKIKKLAQTFLAIQGEIDKVAEIGKVFETDSLYEKTFKSEFLKSDSRKIILAYKIQFRLNAILKEIESKGENKYFFIKYGKNLVWALVFQGLLNDDKIDDLLENYGNNLTVEADFNAIIKDIGSKKVRLIIAELIKQKKYQDYVENGKFSFLKSRVAFIDCMTIASKRYGWEMLSITHN